MPRDYYDQSRVNNHKRPPTAPVKKGPVHNGGSVGLYNYNDSPAPLPPAARRRAPNGGK